MKPAEPTAGEWESSGLGVMARHLGAAISLGRAEYNELVPYGEACDNARLFAASKDMLSALQDAEFHLADLSPDNSALGGIRAAIAKAKGEA